jgi:peroxiredoxin Q/BCP
MPAFELASATGEIVRSADLVGRGPLVIYFYPKDETLGCTIESCAFRDRHPEFLAAGATVLGVSPDSPESHRRFASRHGLPFTLLSDPERRVFRLFGVADVFGLAPGRETFVVDAAGVVRHHVRANFQPRKHVARALEAVRRLAAAS